MNDDDSPVVDNPWSQLRRFTPARIALGRTGVSLPTAPQLAFQLAHAQALDAVQMELDDAILAQALTDSLGIACIRLRSAVADRAAYLRRPDLGRMLDEESRQALAAMAQPTAPYDLGFVIADGLSAQAVERHALSFLREWLAVLPHGVMELAPLVIVRQGRVAVGDEVGQLLRLGLVVVMIGERPGLSSPDSMGLYMTWQPRVGMTDERRNCISNVRPAGLSYADAARQLHYLVSEARRRRLSGLTLKGDCGDDVPAVSDRSNFLLLMGSDT